MAQVNSSPGQNQTFGNAAVAAQISTQSNPSPGALGPTQIATSVTVPYGQVEPGKVPDATINKIRS
jgi:hypothetical protein